MDDMEEAREAAAKAVAGALDIIAETDCNDVRMPEVLHMLARVLEHPEIVL